MGRKWANIKEKKAAKDANNSRVYAKFGIEIYVAAKSGDPDPHANQKLRFVIERAKTYNVPKHIIDRAIEKAKGSADEQYSELRYEGFGPNGSMVIVDALTNNVNRTAADVRAAFGKNGGNMGVSGAVSYMFDNTGNGFTFDRYESGLLYDTINRAKTCYFENRASWDDMVIRDMNKDVSWETSARQYKDMYVELTPR